jgi:DNA-binding transcriptional MerR regulator
VGAIVAEYRVDELAQSAGTSVRNVRVYQERGLLPPPRRVGRTGRYTEAHLARLRLIRLLLQRGYTFATIGELIEARSSGQGIAELLGLDDAIAVPWTDETPEVRPREGLNSNFAGLAAEDLTRAATLGFISVHDGEVIIPSPRLLEAGAQLVEAGVPPAAVLDLAEQVKSRLEEIARLMFGMFGNHVAQEGRSATDVADALMRLRPLAKQTVDALLSMALDQESRKLLEQRAGRSRKAKPDGTS